MPTRSYGTTIETCTDILMRHKAYQALNLDGGTSAVLWYDGEYVTKCSNTSITSACCRTPGSTAAMAQANNISGPLLPHAPRPPMRMQQFFRLLWNLSGETVPHGGILSGSLSKSTLTFRKNIGIIRLESASCVLLRTSRCPAGKSSFFCACPQTQANNGKDFCNDLHD